MVVVVVVVVVGVVVVVVVVVGLGCAVVAFVLHVTCCMRDVGVLTALVTLLPLTLVTVAP